MRGIFKLFLIFVVAFGWTGCDLSGSDQLACDIGDTVITITVRHGQIVEYNDRIQGDLSLEDIDVLNKNHLQDIENNTDAIKVLREVVANSGGICN